MIRYRHRYWRPAALAAAIALTACAAPPVREVPPLPAAYFSAADGGSVAVDAHTLARWWQTFDDPLLAEFVDSALARNLDVQAALAELRRARAQLRLSRAALVPQLDVAGQGQRQFLDAERIAGSPVGEALGLSDTEHLDFWQFGLTANWEIDLFGANRLRSAAAERQFGAMQAQLVATRLAVAAGVAQGYVQARTLLAQRQVLDESIALARESERVAEGIFRLGQATRLDVEAAGARRAALEATLGDLDAGLAEATFAIDTLTDQAPGTTRARLGDGGTVPRARAAIPTGQPLDLLRRRPDVIAAAAGLEAADAAALASRRDLFPKLGVSATVGRTGFALGGLSTAADSRSLAGSLSFPWFDFGAPRAAIDEADAQADAGFVTLRQTLATALEEVEVASAQHQARQRQRIAVDEAVARAERTHAMARRTYEVGLANLSDVLEAQSELLDMRRQAVEVDSQIALTQIALYSALGGGWRIDGEAVDGLDAIRRELRTHPVPDRIRSSTAE